jgi:hypothetical protein
MKKIIFILMFVSLFLLACEYEDIHNFHLIYSVTSLTEEEVDIDITYKIGNEYITEQTQTPFIVEQDIELDKAKKENFYYYLELTKTSDKNISIYVTSNGEYKTKIDNLQNSYLPLPVYTCGYIGFGLASVNINL